MSYFKKGQLVKVIPNLSQSHRTANFTVTKSMIRMAGKEYIIEEVKSNDSHGTRYKIKGYCFVAHWLESVKGDGRAVEDAVVREHKVLPANPDKGYILADDLTEHDSHVDALAMFNLYSKKDIQGLRINPCGEIPLPSLKRSMLTPSEEKQLYLIISQRSTSS